MIINLSDIMSVEDKSVCMDVPVEMESVTIQGMTYSFASKEPVVLKIHNLGNRIVSLEADIKLSLYIPCSRCLENVEVLFETHMEKELDFSQAEADRLEDLDEINYIDGYNLDVDTLAFDEILLNLPMHVLCKPDCKGICKVCGKNLNHETCQCDTFVGDPRMSVIQDIFKNYKEV